MEHSTTPNHQSPLKKKTFIKSVNENNPEAQDDFIDNLLLENKNLKTQTLIFEKFKTDKPRCPCDLCDLDLEYIKKKEEMKKKPNFDSDYNPLDDKFSREARKINDQEKDFVFILKRLQPIKPINRNFGILIPDTACFQNCEAKFIIYTQKQNKQLKFVKQKEKLTSHQIRKYFQEKRKKPKENEISASPDIINLPKETKEIVICKYSDDTTQMLSENEFIALITKRKQDAAWKEIQYLQLFVKSKKYPYELIKIKFKWNNLLKFDALYKRAQTDISIANGDIPSSSADFITLEEEENFQEKLKNNNIIDFCKYLFYKIHIFIEKFYSILIIKVYNEFLKDEGNGVNYINAYNLKYEEVNNKFFISDELYKKIMNDPAIKQKEMLRRQYDELQKNELYALFAKLFYQDYEQRKNQNGLDLHISKPEQTLNEEIFNKIYPNSLYKLSDLLSNTMSIEEIKKIMITGVSSKPVKKDGFQMVLNNRKKLFNTYTLPILRNNKKTKEFPKNTKNSIFQTPKQKSTTSSFDRKDLNDRRLMMKSSSNYKNQHYVKSPTVKITYQLGPALTDTHSIRIQGKLLENIRKRNNLTIKSNNNNGILMKTEQSVENESALKRYEMKMPTICVHEVEFVNVFH